MMVGPFRGYRICRFSAVFGSGVLGFEVLGLRGVLKGLGPGDAVQQGPILLGKILLLKGVQASYYGSIKRGLRRTFKIIQAQWSKHLGRI